MPTYEELLQRAYEKLPARATGSERFVVPTVEVGTVGTQTMIKNFGQICDTLRRDPKHLLKWLSKELATPAQLDLPRAVLLSRVHSRTIQGKLESYVKEFVFCKECRRPDTRLEREDRIAIMVCEACGARSAVKQI